METAINVGGSSGGERTPLLRLISNKELDARTQEAESEQYEPPISEMVAHLHRLWEDAVEAKQPIAKRIIEADRTRKLEYPPEKLAAIRDQVGGSEVYIGLTKTKCKAAKAWLRDILLPVDDRPWTIRPTPNASLPTVIETQISQRVSMETAFLESQGIAVNSGQKSRRLMDLQEAVRREMQVYAKDACRRMEKVIQDKFLEGNFYEALYDAISHVVDYPTGFLRGSVFKNKKTIKYKMFPDGTTRPIVDTGVVGYWYAPHPFDMYPSPNSRAPDDGYLFERHYFRRKDLYDLIGSPGIKEDAVRLVLKHHGDQDMRKWLYLDNERERLNDRPYWFKARDPLIEAIEFHGSVSGRMLREWGMKDSEVPDPDMEYEANVLFVGRWAIKAVLNKDPLGRRGYYAASYETIPGRFWGEGVTEACEDAQAIANAVARALVNNVAVAAGPQVEVFEDRLLEGEEINSVMPMRIWQTKSDPTGGGHRALNFHQPSLVAHNLIRISDWAQSLADNASGIPAYAYGEPDVGGAGRTAAGLSMLMSSASKGLRQIVKHIDAGIMQPAVTHQFDREMMFNPDQSIKGDAQVQAKGAVALIAKEQQVIRRQEFLNQTNNPADLAIMGQEGRAALLREVVNSLDMKGSEVIPDEMELKHRIAREAMSQMALGQQQPGNPSPQSGPGGPPALGAPTTEAGDRPTDQNQFPNTPLS